MNRNLLAPFTVAILTCLCLTSGCSKQQQSAPDNTVSKPSVNRSKVRATETINHNFAGTMDFSASIEAIASAVLVPKSMGRVAEVLVRVGDEVSSGQLLMKIEGRDYLAGFQEAKAAHQLAKLQHQQALTNLKRFEELKKQNAVTDAQYEEVLIGSQLAEGQAQRAGAGFEIAKNRLVDTELFAPFSGTIISRNVETGEMLGGNIQRPPLMIADVSSLRFIAQVPEREIAQLSTGMSGTLIVGAKKLPVTVERINKAVDPVVRTVQIEGTVENSDGALLHGQSARLSLVLAARVRPAVPRSALLNRVDGTAELWVVDASDKLSKRNVQYESSNEQLVPITDGVSVGEKVLYSGHTRLNEQSTIEIIEN